MENYDKTDVTEVSSILVWHQQYLSYHLAKLDS